MTTLGMLKSLGVRALTEQDKAKQIFEDPQTDYTQALLHAALDLEVDESVVSQ